MTFDKPIQVPGIPANTFSDTTIKAFNAITTASFLKYRLNDLFAISKIMMNGEKFSTYLERYINLNYKNISKEVRGEVIQKLLDVASQDKNLTEDVIVDFHKRMDHPAGYFGDAGSCFYNGYQHQRAKIHQHGGCVGRIWKLKEKVTFQELGSNYSFVENRPEYHKLSPLARVIMYPVKDKGYILTNVYSKTGWRHEDVYQMIAKALNVPFKMVTVNGNGLIYINSSVCGYAGEEVKEPIEGSNYFKSQPNLYDCIVCGKTFKPTKRRPILMTGIPFTHGKCHQYCHNCGRYVMNTQMMPIRFLGTQKPGCIYCTPPRS